MCDVRKDSYRDICWDPSSGLSPEVLEQEVAELEKQLAGRSKSYVKAKTFELLLEKGQISVTREDIFQEKLNARHIMTAQRNRWWEEAKANFRDMLQTVERAERTKAFCAHEDFGHTSPNTKMLVELGYCGLIDRLAEAEKRVVTITEKQRDFYHSAGIALMAMQRFCKRLSQAEGITKENARCLAHLSEQAPRHLYEALQLLVVTFYLHEYVAGTRVRTLGRLDEILYPLYRKDLDEGVLDRDGAKEMLKCFLYKLWTMRVPYDLPFCLGGVDKDGKEITNELSYLMVEAYRELDIHSPKIHVRVSDQTPEAFVKLVLRCIRSGNSSFVFVNDAVTIEALMKCGVTREEARSYVLIGCYEPSVFDLELPCTGNGHINLPKMIELVFCRGRDLETGELVGLDTGAIDSYEDFISALKTQIAYCIDLALTYIGRVEGCYMQANPDPILSAMLSPCVERGIDAYDGGAKYNNSSFYIHSIASLADSVIAVKQLVFEQKRVGFDELGDILRANWKGHEKLRMEMDRSSVKYGNNVDAVDEIAVEFADFCAKRINGTKNGRGGIFKAANFTIDECFANGKRVMATPDGRYAGEPLSKNLCAVTGKDKRGITALIHSVTKMPLSDFPNGSVLDFVLHPSAVRGEDGLSAFYGLLKTYFKKGGMAIHGNVFDAEQLKQAQKNPEQYRHLQVRVCGWNAYFVNLSRAEQDAFIKQAEPR